MKDLAQNFAYINPATGRDEGLNVRTKAQKLVDLVLNDQRLEEERSKATAASVSMGCPSRKYFCVCYCSLTHGWWQSRLGGPGISSNTYGGGYDAPSTTQPFQPGAAHGVSIA